jgi:hypothetical protein
MRIFEPPALHVFPLGKARGQGVSKAKPAVRAG